MSKEIERKIGSTIYARVNALPLSEVKRQRALNALYEADLLVDGLIWAAKKIEHLGERLFLKPATRA